jgi:arylsulfatase A-like enzyme
MQKKKNVIWIMSDQHRGQMLSCNGDPNARTPNLDNMAVYGINFRNAVGGYPLCCPFRGAMLTGLYPHKCVPGHEYPMAANQRTVAHVFNENGYHTAYFGKWHLDGFTEMQDNRASHHIVPKERRGGFQHWLGYENNNSQWDCWVHGQRVAAPDGSGGGGEEVHYRLPGYETDALTDLFISHLRETSKGEKPFFAVLSVQPPHNPYAAPAEFMGKYNPAQIELRPNVPDIPAVRERARRDLAGAYAMVENLDWNIGRIVNWLMETGLYCDTHILFFADHGDFLGSHGHWMKTSPYEESIKVPFIISGEQPAYEGRMRGISHYPINHVDIAPTSLGLCGIDAPAEMEGTDYSWVRLADRPKKTAPDSAYLQSVVPTGHDVCVGKPWRGVLTADGWKYACFENAPWVLFNLNEDPYEQVNLAHYPKNWNKLKELNDRCKKWAEDTGDVFAFPDERGWRSRPDSSADAVQPKGSNP